MNSVTGPTQTNPAETSTIDTNSGSSELKPAEVEGKKAIEDHGVKAPTNWGLFIENVAGTVAAICLAISLYVAWLGATIRSASDAMASNPNCRGMHCCSMDHSPPGLVLD